MTSTTLTFARAKLTPIEGTPTYFTVTRLKQEAYENAISIASNRGGGAHGHLALIIPDDEYYEISKKAFEPANHPGHAPIIPPGTTAVGLSDLNRKYQTDLDDYTTCQQVHTQLRTLILDAVDKVYVAKLADKFGGHSKVSVKDILQHLTDNYTDLTADDLDANRQRIQTAWNINAPIEEFWATMKEIQDLAEAGKEPISDRALINEALTLLEITSVFVSACREYRLIPEDKWTMDTFQAKITAENKLRRRPQPVAPVHYHQANAATDEAPGHVPKIPTCQVIALADGTPVAYCWSHGLGFNLQHTSATCKSKKDGHQDDATFSGISTHGGCVNVQKPRSNRTNQHQPRSSSQTQRSSSQTQRSSSQTQRSSNQTQSRTQE